MEIHVDTREVASFAKVMFIAPKEFQTALRRGLGSFLANSVKTAQGFAPKKTGALAAAIRILEPLSVGAEISGSFGVQKTEALPYPFMREYGGVIRPVKGKFLVFRGREGGLVFAREVTQVGSRYMGKTRDVIEPRFRKIIESAVERTLGRLS